MSSEHRSVNGGGGGGGGRGGSTHAPGPSTSTSTSTSSTTPAAAAATTTTTPASDAHECSVCHKTFSRQEHLRRHFLTHDNLKPHVCDVCHRAYSRPDVLLRHKATHHAADADGYGHGGYGGGPGSAGGSGGEGAGTSGPGGGPGSSARRHEDGDRFRACRECAQARVRCSGREPCARCARTGKACRYPEARNRRGGSRTSSSPARAAAGGGGAGSGGMGGYRAQSGGGSGGGGVGGGGSGFDTYGGSHGHGHEHNHGQPLSAMTSRPPSPGYYPQPPSAMNTRPPSPAYHHAHQNAAAYPHPYDPPLQAHHAHPHASTHAPAAAPLAFPTDPVPMYPPPPPPAAPPPLSAPLGHAQSSAHTAHHPPPAPAHHAASASTTTSDPLGMLAGLPAVPAYAAADMSHLSSTVARTSALPPNWLGDIGTMWDDLLQYQDLFSFAPDEGFGTNGINWLQPAQTAGGGVAAASMPGLNQWDGAGLSALSQELGMQPPQQTQTMQTMSAPGPGQTLPPMLPSIMNMSAQTTPAATPNGGGNGGGGGGNGGGVSAGPASTGVSSTRSKYYVGGDGGRAAQLKRPIRKRAMKAQIFMASLSQRVPDVMTYHPDISPEWVTPETYHAMRREVLGTRDEATGGSTSMPSLADFNLFVQSYIDEFHTNFPLFRRNDIKAQVYSPLEVIAISAIGAGHIGVKPAKKISLDLHAVVRRMVEAAAVQHSTGPDRPSGKRDDLGQLRAQLLNVLGMFHSGEQELVGYAYAGRATLVATCLQLKLLEPIIRPIIDEHSAQAKQRNFLDQQARSRIGYGIWLLDCMIAYQTDMRPMMTLQDANAPMPCSDTLWEDVEAKWPVIANGQRVPASLREALETLYTEKRIMYNCTDVGRTIMIHGIYQRTWEVEKLNQDLLNNWKPAGFSHRGHSERKSASAAQATIAEWRNSACDCLDVLHFAANIRVASATGLEHALILHLHVSRIILLTPVRRMQELVLSHTPQTRLDMYEEILKWALQDQYKARLAVLHAASVFWHVRRYSCDAVIEPYTIYVATLILWIYSISRIVNKQAGYAAVQQEPTPVDDIEPLEFTNLNLDRPCDDESGMAWIRSGDQVEAHIFRVGPICKPGAPDKILKEGARLLSKQDCNTGPEAAFIWGCSETYLRDLNWFRACLAQHNVGN